jgi:predicted transcriptional regulator
MKTNNEKEKEKPPVVQQRPQFQKDWVSKLVLIVQELRLQGVEQIASMVQKIALKQDQKSAEKLVKGLAALYYKNQLNPNHFASFESDTEGEITLGATTNGKPFGLRIEEDLPKHVFISGQSGSGKSNLLELIICQLFEKKIHCVTFDRKSDLTHLVKDGILSIHWTQIRKNFLCPPNNYCSIHEWRNDHCKAFPELMQSFQRGGSIYLQAVDLLYKQFQCYERWANWNWDTMAFPTMKDLYVLLKSKEFSQRIVGTGKDSLASLIDKVEAMCIELEPILSCQKGFDIGKLYKSGCTISYNIEPLGQEYQSFLIVNEILSYTHYFRNHGPRNKTNTVLVFDESKGIWGKQNEKSFILSDLVSKSREYGVSLISADQIPSQISQFLFSNIGTLIFGRHSDGFDLQRLRYASGESVPQALNNYSLKSGEFIVRKFGLADLHKIIIPFKPVEKFISKEELDQIMAPKITELMADVIPHKTTQKAPDLKEDSKANSSLLPEDKEFLRCLASDFNRPSSEIYKELGWNESKGYRVKQKLIKQGFITQVSTNLGAGGKRAQYLVPNQIVVDQFGIKLMQGRGKSLHKYFQSEIAEHARKYGFKAVIEECVGTSEGPDVGLTKNGKRIAVEVSVTSKPSTEKENISKNMRLGYDFVVLTFITKQALEKTKEIAGKNEKARLCLVSDFAEVLYGIPL